MSLWSNLIDGFKGGVVSVVRDAQISCHSGKIERLCRELGWSVDERDGTAIRLHFDSPFGVRKVRITGGDDSLVTFSAYSCAVVPTRSVPAEVIAYLLRRNIHGSGLGMWGMHVDDDNDVMFHLIYQALGAGLDAAALKCVCESLASEVDDFDDKMRQSGLLR